MKKLKMTVFSQGNIALVGKVYFSFSISQFENFSTFKAEGIKLLVRLNRFDTRAISWILKIWILSSACNQVY